MPFVFGDTSTDTTSESEVKRLRAAINFLSVSHGFGSIIAKLSTTADLDPCNVWRTIYDALSMFKI
jgi:hypothetical protein